ncbi:aldolase [Paenibacillus sacheonensis]|uniref:Aldolase n=1 Tax=Paenibacillus sacheonensis TaxID=742054 RepID=A0A7X5BYX4_9BACL|nr:aldolase [Paenibacillus sacheonensis]MBM7567330.1 hypothetical protein [Paenibacillus sacheonensis]NBC69886.1 aldolase [Paenibacillus sacheonensis]
MTQTTIDTYYEAFGLKLTSEFVLPETIRCQEQNHRADVEISRADLSADWARADVYQRFYAAHEDGILFHVPDLAVFSIQSGCRIIVSPVQGADERSIRMYLLGTCMGVILMQRGFLTLHGSTVVIDGLAYAFVGHSGVGKSTLAAAFAIKGYSLMTDDVIAVASRNGMAPAVTPGYPQQKLWQESLHALGMQSDDYAPLYGTDSKLAVPIANNYCSVEVPLGGVFELLPVQEKSLTITQVRGLSCFPLLLNHTYRNLLIPLLKKEQAHFTASTHVISHCPIHQVKRPFTGCDALYLADNIVQSIRKEKVG